MELGMRRFPLSLLLLCFLAGLAFAANATDITKGIKEALKQIEKEKGDLKNVSAAGLNPKWNPAKWVALGDSFAAGPGAGELLQDEPQCIRGSMAYPFQMQDDGYMPGPTDDVKPEYISKACTGDVTTDLVNRDNPNYQLAAISPSVDFVTLSIGGNDILFSTILKKCIYGWPLTGDNCDQTIENARKILYGAEFAVNYNNVIRGILDKMQWQQRRDRWNTAIFQTGYAQFFDSYTTQCDNARFALGITPKITRDKRINLNRLTHEVNYVTQYWIDLYNTENTKESRWNPYTVPINYVNVDLTYVGHRFCREGVNEPDRDNPDTHFFHLGLDDDRDDLKVLDVYDDPKAENRPVTIMRVFHPTTGGFDHTAEHVLTRLDFRGTARVAASNAHDFNFMVLGDYICYADQDSRSDNYQGFIPHLKAILRDRNFYGYPLGVTQPRLNPIFVGSQVPASPDGERHECHQSATLDRLFTAFQQSPDRDIQGKTVLLMAGTHDLMYALDLEHAKDRIERIINAIFRRDPTATVLLTHIPMIGLAEDANGAVWYELNKNIATFNARLSAIANEYLQQDKSVVVVHTSATPLEHEAGSPILPNRAGYRRMAHNVAEALVEAGAMGLITRTDPPHHTDSLVLSGPDYFSKHVTEEAQCVAFRGFTTGQPKKEDIRDAYIQSYKNIDEWIEKVACNRTEVCKYSPDGIHGSPSDPKGMSQNATRCFRPGGETGKPDHNLLNITMPDTNYNLENSSCGKAIKAIINDCIMSNRASGGYWKANDGLEISLTPTRVIGSANEAKNFTREFYDSQPVLDLLRKGKKMDPPPWWAKGVLSGMPLCGSPQCGSPEPTDKDYIPMPTAWV